MASPLWVPQRGEIIFINFSPCEGKEIPDDHPMLVATTRAFNERVGIVIGFPMTHSQMHRTNPFAVSVSTGFVLAFQPKSFDWRARRARPHPLGLGNDKLLQESLAILDTICGTNAAQ